MFIGNGGSAAIASHMAIDFTKNGGMPAMCFNDGAALTCLGNDLGYEEVFAGAASRPRAPGGCAVCHLQLRSFLRKTFCARWPLPATAAAR
jgi:hypothetical protein